MNKLSVIFKELIYQAPSFPEFLKITTIFSPISGKKNCSNFKNFMFGLRINN